MMLPVLKKFTWRQALRICAERLMGWQRLFGFSSSWIHMIKIHCFFFAADAVTGSKHCYGNEMDFCSCIKGLKMVHSAGQDLRMRLWRSHRSSSGCWCRAWRSLSAIRSQNLKNLEVLCSLCNMLKIKNCKNRKKASIHGFFCLSTNGCLISLSRKR